MENIQNKTVAKILGEERIKLLKNKIIDQFEAVLMKSVNDCSNNDLALVKNVSLSSIMSAKKAGYSKEQILLLDGKHSGPLTAEQKLRRKETHISKLLAGLSAEDLAKYGLSVTK